MAKFIVCCVVDHVVQACMMPMFFRSKGEAVRSFGDAVGDPKSEWCKHPEDYEMYAYGEWDDKGTFEIYNVPERLAKAIDYSTSWTVSTKSS